MEYTDAGLSKGDSAPARIAFRAASCLRSRRKKKPESHSGERGTLQQREEWKRVVSRDVARKTTHRHVSRNVPYRHADRALDASERVLGGSAEDGDDGLELVLRRVATWTAARRKRGGSLCFFKRSLSYPPSHTPHGTLDVCVCVCVCVLNGV